MAPSVEIVIQIFWLAIAGRLVYMGYIANENAKPFSFLELFQFDKEKQLIKEVVEARFGGGVYGGIVSNHVVNY